MGTRSFVDVFVLAALSDDAQAVVVEVSEAEGPALDEFHLAMEALGDAVVFGKACSVPPDIWTRGLANQAACWVLRNELRHQYNALRPHQVHTWLR